LEPELPNRDFPAWSLLDSPALNEPLEKANCLRGAEIPKEYQVIRELVAVRGGGLTDLIEQRKRLKSLNPALFDHYLKRFGRS
jgi:hypothetical protein